MVRSLIFQSYHLDTDMVMQRLLLMAMAPVPQLKPLLIMVELSRSMLLTTVRVIETPESSLTAMVMGLKREPYYRHMVDLENKLSRL